MLPILFLILLFIQNEYSLSNSTLHEEGNSIKLQISVFDIDATPPVGSHMAYNPVKNTWDMGLRARGIVLTGSGKPIVLCSVDWIGIGNDSQDEFKRVLGDAAGTTPDRVAVHTIHQHDAPICDFGAEKYLLSKGLNPMSFESSFTRKIMYQLADAIKSALKDQQPVTHIGMGEADVYKVASNRRIAGPDGKIKATRYTTTKDSALRAEPEGLIDPKVSVVSFWNGEKPLAVLSYYACHPQSYYLTGLPNPDYPGIARFYRQLAVPDALHVHFNGAGGDLGAGKYNDGSKENRGILAERLADGMKRAWEGTKKEPVTAESVSWSSEPVSLPPARFPENFNEDLKAKGADAIFLTNTIPKIMWLERCKQGRKIDITCLSIGHARILHLPGELMVEFQLAAKAARQDLFVVMAAYGDYGPEYICTDAAYVEGGYEASGASGVAPGSEKVVMDAIKKLLRK